jgi:hypothetical protein
MRVVILDTNVIVGASGLSTEMSDRCMQNCTQRIKQWRQRKTLLLVIDSEHRILDEYINQFKSSRRKQTFPGSLAEALMIELINLRNITDDTAQSYAIKRVKLTVLDADEFEEYPKDDQILAKFDRSDRKFIATALSCQQEHELTPEILNAADSDWDMVAEHLLNTYSIPVSNICG